MLNLEERIDVLVKLGERLKQEEAMPEALLYKVKAHNPWFIPENVNGAISGIVEQYLDKDKLEEWVSEYSIIETTPKKVGLILAGNIPLVGIHDVISVFIAGHYSYLKLSDKDNILLPIILEEIAKISKETQPYFNVVERLTEFDAVIATGSNNSQKYFEKYFSQVPSIIRANRNGVAVIYKDSTPDDLSELGKDIFSYFGLGCRNVSKLYLEEGVELKQFYEPIEKYYDIINHHKYKNNYDYTNALYLMNKEEYFSNNFLILRPNTSLSSRISAVHFERFSDTANLVEELELRKGEIQCIVSDRGLGTLKVLNFGMSQKPGLKDYADDIDTIEFLLTL